MPDGSDCLSPDPDNGDPFEYIDRATCYTMPLKIKYKMVNLNDVTVKVKSTSELLFNGTSIFDLGDVDPVFGVEIQPKRATDRVINVMFDTCKIQELSFSMSLKFKDTTEPNLKRFGGCKFESTVHRDSFPHSILFS
jgi:hypothetical protein